MDYLKHIIHRLAFFLRYDRRLFLSFLVVSVPLAYTFFVDGASIVGWALTLVGVAWFFYESYGTYIDQRRGHAAIMKFPDQVSRSKPEYSDLIKCKDGVAISYPLVNARLDRVSISFRASDKSYMIPENIRSVYGNIFRFKKIRLDTTNDKKVRLWSDLDHELLCSQHNVTLNIQKTDYFSSYLTNEASNLLVRHRDGSDRANGSDYYVEKNRIIGLSESKASNHVGVSILAVSGDGYVLYQLQGEQEQGKQKFGPTASGSLDWDDVQRVVAAGSCDFSKVVKLGMLRELTEETSAVGTALEDRLKLIGYCRYLTRGGKPEFFGFLRTSQRHDQIKLVPRRERKKVSRIESFKIDSSSRAEFITSIEKFHRYIKSQEIEHTLSLEATIVLLREYMMGISDDGYRLLMSQSSLTR